MLRRFSRALALLVIAAFLALVGYEVFALWRAHQRTPHVVELAAQGELRVQDLTARRTAMLLKVEDPGFYSHKGVDLSTPGQGATTITQGLVKRFYFKGFKPGLAKIEQSLIARFIFDPALAKDRQLQAYLNYTYLGNVRGEPIIGYANASRAYFDREFRELSDGEFLALLAMTIAPSQLDPLRNPQANAERVSRIARLLSGKCAPVRVADIRYESCA